MMQYTTDHGEYGDERGIDQSFVKVDASIKILEDQGDQEGLNDFHQFLFWFNNDKFR